MNILVKLAALSLERAEADRLLVPEAEMREKAALLGPGGRQVFPEVFDGLGAELLRRAAGDDACGLILMDELGFLEAGAAGFRKAVLDVLAGPKPVLGVVRQGLGAWQDAPLGELWEVTKENRDAVPDRLRRRLAALLPEAFL